MAQFCIDTAGSTCSKLHLIIHEYCEDNAYCLATKLYASIPALMLQQSGFGQIMVQNPSPTLASSTAQLLTVNGLVPTITPNGVVLGSATLLPTPLSFNMSIIVNGTNFGPQTQIAVFKDGSTPQFAAPTQVLSSTQLYHTFMVTSPDSIGTWDIQIVNPSPGGGVANTQFTLSAGNFNTSPFLVSMNPTTVAVGGPGFTLSLSGTNFETGASVQFYTTLLPATVINGTLVTVQIPAYLIASAGRFPITLINPDGGGASNRLYLDVQ